MRDRSIIEDFAKNYFKNSYGEYAKDLQVTMYADASSYLYVIRITFSENNKFTEWSMSFMPELLTRRIIFEEIIKRIDSLEEYFSHSKFNKDLKGMLDG